MFFRASLVAAAILAAGSAVGAVGFAVPALADVSDDYFIQALDGYGFQYDTIEKAILEAKTYVCSQLDANPGETIDDVVSGVATNTNWSNADSAFFTGSAIAAYCPQYKAIVDAPPPVDGPMSVPIS
jgi:Protein of unknown function (DUF732)